MQFGASARQLQTHVIEVDVRGPLFLDHGRTAPYSRQCGLLQRAPIELLRPYPADEMKAQKVNTDVGNVKNNYPEWLNSV